MALRDKKKKREEKVIKKYSNRRLYDTTESQYITLEELAATIRDGYDVRVIDAKSGSDLTQATLAQIVVESRGAAKLLPVPLLLQMIRMGEDALAEFMTLYMSWALDVYTQVKRGMRDVSGFNPFGMMGFNPSQALQRLFSLQAPWLQQGNREGFRPPPTPSASEEPEEGEDAPPIARDEDVAALRREIEALRESLSEVVKSKNDD